MTEAPDLPPDPASDTPGDPPEDRAPSQGKGEGEPSAAEPVEPQGLHESDERVRACTACGEIVPFETRNCSACGHHDPIVAPGFQAGGRTRNCVGCGEQVAETLLFCPTCGVERDPAPRTPRPSARDDEGRDARPLVWAAYGLSLLGPLILLAAALTAMLA